MKFHRQRIAPLPSEFLRIVGARSGFLLDSPDCLRVGIGPVVATVDMPLGIDGSSADDQFSGHTLTGEPGLLGSGIVAMGSIPFDRTRRSSLAVCAITISQFGSGETFVTSVKGAPSLADLLSAVMLPTQALQAATNLTFHPTGEQYAQSVARAVEDLQAGRMTKVVLARSVVGDVSETLDVAAVALRLRQREPLCTIYALPLPDGRRFVGASPELLVARKGTSVACHPLAGTIAIPHDVQPDQYHKWLLGSTKNQREHAIVANEIVSALQPHYSDVHADASPSIVTLHSVAHLGTWIRGTAPANTPSALELVSMLHPTPAVGGLPRIDAYQAIQQFESTDRGHYAGPVGWIDANGDGEWWIGIRGVMVSGTSFEAWAGAGIVSESDPIAEREETKDKLQSVLSAVISDRL